MGVLGFGTGTLVLGIRNRRRATALVAGAAAGAAVVGFPTGIPGPAALATGFAVPGAAGFPAFTSAFSACRLNAVHARNETRARSPSPRNGSVSARP